jgi:hypothetical protein
MNTYDPDFLDNAVKDLAPKVAKWFGEDYEKQRKENELFNQAKEAGEIMDAQPMKGRMFDNGHR